MSHGPRGDGTHPSMRDDNDSTTTRASRGAMVIGDGVGTIGRTMSTIGVREPSGECRPAGRAGGPK